MHCTSRIPTQRRHFNALTRLSALSALPSHTLFFRKWRYCRANNIFFSFQVLAQRLLSAIGTQPALWLLRCVGQRLSARLSPSHLSNPQAFPLFIPPHSTPRAVFLRQGLAPDRLTYLAAHTESCDGESELPIGHLQIQGTEVSGRVR